MNEEQIQQLIDAGNQVLQAADQGDESAKVIKLQAEVILQDQNALQQVLQQTQSLDERESQIATLVIGTAMALRDMEQNETIIQQPTTVSYAKNGAKFRYIQSLNNRCPEGYETAYYKRGGSIVKGCKKCAKKAAEGTKVEKPKNSVELFKCGKRIKKGGDGLVALDEKKSWSGSTDGSGSEAERYWKDGTKSYRQKGVDTPKGKATFYEGRRGERGNTLGTKKEREIADSLERADWKNKFVKNINKRK